MQAKNNDQLARLLELSHLGKGDQDVSRAIKLISIYADGNVDSPNDLS